MREVKNKESLMVGIASTLHFLVDALCMCCIYLMAEEWTGKSSIEMIFAYNAFAFLTQPVTGAIVDKIDKKHWMLLLSMVMILMLHHLIIRKHWRMILSIIMGI